MAVKNTKKDKRKCLDRQARETQKATVKATVKGVICSVYKIKGNLIVASFGSTAVVKRQDDCAFD